MVLFPTKITEKQFAVAQKSEEAEQMRWSTKMDRMDQAIGRLEHGRQIHFVTVENRHGGVSVHGVDDASIEKIKRRFQVKI